MTIQKKRFRTESEKAEIISKYKSSGLSHLAFCKQEGIASSSLHGILKKPVNNPIKKKQASFVELKPSFVSSRSEVELCLTNGLVLRIRG